MKSKSRSAGKDKLFSKSGNVQGGFQTKRLKPFSTIPDDDPEVNENRFQKSLDARGDNASPSLRPGQELLEHCMGQYDLPDLSD
jgi:hypothetical protein